MYIGSTVNEPISGVYAILLRPARLRGSTCCLCSIRTVAYKASAVANAVVHTSVMVGGTTR